MTVRWLAHDDNGDDMPRTARVWHGQGEALIDRWRDGQSVPASHFDLRVTAERWAGWAEPDRLVSLDSLRGVERFPHQLRACLRAMGTLNGRATPFCVR